MVKTLIKNSNYLEEVRNQYENYPYPPRIPENEKIHFSYCHASALDCFNHYIYSGKRDFSKDFRVLVAGGGTGDSTIMLAEQLREFGSEIVHLDISETSIKVAQERARIRGLGNITWVHGSLLDVAKILDGKFDHINCSGVLHHLESPEAGLMALTSMLKDDGFMALMVYARPGRENIYQIQSLMRILNKNDQNMQSKIEKCKVVLKHLPQTNGFKQMESTFKDVKSYGDVGIYDLLLHSNDVAYSIPDLYKFLESSNLELNHLLLAVSSYGNNIYKPEAYINDSEALNILTNLTLQDKQAAAELMHGKIMKHVFFASKTKTSLPSIDNLNNVPFFSMIIGAEFHKQLFETVKSVEVGNEVVCKAYHMEVKCKKTANAEFIFKYMDGYKSIKEIFNDVRASYPANKKKPTIEELKKEFQIIFDAFNLHDWMYLRDKSVPLFKTIKQMRYSEK